MIRQLKQIYYHNHRNLIGHLKKSSKTSYLGLDEHRLTQRCGEASLFYKDKINQAGIECEMYVSQYKHLDHVFVKTSCGIYFDPTWLQFIPNISNLESCFIDNKNTLYTFCKLNQISTQHWSEEKIFIPSKHKYADNKDYLKWHNILI